MKVRNNRLYPYPVYTLKRNDYLDNNFYVESSLEYDYETADIILKISISDNVILNMIKETKIGIFCHVECPSTKYRALFPISLIDNDNVIVQIPLHHLNNNIEVLTILVALENIENYENSNLNNDFIGEVISFPQFATIGYSDTDIFTITKRINNNGDVPSIFNITKSEGSTQMKYDYIDDQITIFLPKDEYAIYEAYRGVSKRLKQMMINLPVLVSLLNEIKNDTGDNFSSYGWYPILEKAVLKQNFHEFSSAEFKDEDTLEIAQKILGDLVKDAFKEFDDLNGDK